MKKLVYACGILTLLAVSCSKDSSTHNTDDRLSRPYCNDPLAVNYNQTFPGTPDSSICYFPTWVFRGDYIFYDSVYDGDYQRRDSTQYQIRIVAVDKVKLLIKGFCDKDQLENSPLTFTADRFYKATADSTLTADSVKLSGQLACNIKDTISGFILRDKYDTTLLHINITVLTDTGAAYHIGSAKKK